jgi:N6-adenosine-specific RNA methylase IME4
VQAQVKTWAYNIRQIEVKLGKGADNYTYVIRGMRVKYRTFIADPPWKYGRSPSRGAACREYDCMSVDEICDLPVASVAHDNSILLLWATMPQLVEAFQVMTAWGFKYVTAFPWLKVTDIFTNFWGEVEFKPQFGIGYWARGCTELVMICRRGVVSPPDANFIGLISHNYQHSRKPDDIYQYAEALEGPYLELFARRPRQGWSVFGNQVEGSIDLWEKDTS